jgi:hypothetical protein
VWTFVGNIEWILIIHNNCIFPYYGYNIEIVWIYYGFSGAIANFVVWISHFFPVSAVRALSAVAAPGLGI